MLFNFEGESLLKKRIVGVYDEEVPPVPIPNTVVKLLGAENTWLATARENRAMPTFSFFYAHFFWPVSQAVKTLASHAEVRSSTLLRVTKTLTEASESFFISISGPLAQLVRAPGS